VGPPRKTNKPVPCNAGRPYRAPAALGVVSSTLASRRNFAASSGAWVDVEARAPFEPRRLGQLRHEFDVPVVILVRRILRRRCVYDQVVRGLSRTRSAFISSNLSALARFRTCATTSSRRQTRGSWGVSRSQRETSERTGQSSENLRSPPPRAPILGFLPDGIAEHASLFIDVILLRSL